MTSHTSQGKTVDKVILSQSTLSQSAASREQFYVSVSRARQQVEIFTDDKEGLYQAVYQSKQRKAALDMQDQSEQLKEEQKSRELHEGFVKQGKEMTNEKAVRLRQEAEERLKLINDETKFKRKSIKLRLKL